MSLDDYIVLSVTATAAWTFMSARSAWLITRLLFQQVRGMLALRATHGYQRDRVRGKQIKILLFASAAQELLHICFFLVGVANLLRPLPARVPTEPGAVLGPIIIGLGVAVFLLVCAEQQWALAREVEYDLRAHAERANG